MASYPIFPETFTLETRRCRLRHIDLADIPHVFDATRYPNFNEGMLWEPPDNMEQLLVPHQRNVESWHTGTAYCFTIESLLEGKFIGRIAVRREQHGRASVGYWIHPREQGKGYAKEATARVVQFGFEELGLDQLTATHATWNIASRRVLEYAGFCYVEHIPEGFTKRGEWVPEDRLRITREQWLQRAAEGAGNL